MTENITGKGLDIPMLGIRRAVDEIWSSKCDNESHTDNQNREDLKAIFEDSVFDTSLKFKLSTSQVSSYKYDIADKCRQLLQRS